MTAASANPARSAVLAAELAQLEVQAVDARAVLLLLQQAVMQSEFQLQSGHSAYLREANEQLVFAMMRAQSEQEHSAQALAALSRSAALDSLTSLPNRALLLQRFADAIAIAEASTSGLSLLFLDLDDFKYTNDKFGHAVGDQVLITVARQLVNCLSDVDTVSRYGGDEFLLLLPGAATAADAVVVAERVLAYLVEPNQIAGHTFRLSTSIGVAVYPGDGETAYTLIDHADMAMYRAKQQGGGVAVSRRDTWRVSAPEQVAPNGAQRHGLDMTTIEQDRRQLLLREANEQLVLAAISAQELRTAAEEAQRQQLEFMAMLAHELRNPLAPIRTSAALLGWIQTDEPLVRRVQAVIERQVIHMSRLVGDLLDVARLRTGKLRVELIKTEMTTVINGSIDMCRSSLEKRQQLFNVQLPPYVLPVYGDPVRLTQVFSNLLDNASKYTPEGGTVSIALLVAGEFVVTTVSDSGIGIAAESLPDVFNLFVQDRHAIGLNRGGLGIGLTVVRELVAAHGGTVTASSAGTGHGSQFVVTLPMCATADVI